MAKMIRKSLIRMIVPLLPLIDLAAVIFPLRQISKTKPADLA